jgi:hypothetical protein
MYVDIERLNVVVIDVNLCTTINITPAFVFAGEYGGGT